MQIKLKEIVNSEKAIKELIKIKFPIKTSYRIKRLFDKIQPDLDTFREKNLELFKKYGTHDSEKDIYLLDIPENIPTFNKEFSELVDLDVNLDFEKIKIDELSETEVEPQYLVSWIFE